MHIVIVNAHWNNRGDEAAHRTLWEKLVQLYPQGKITIIFKDKQPVTWFPENIKATYFSCQFKASQLDIWLAVLSRGLLVRDDLLRKMTRTLMTADLIIYPPGGSVINDRFFWTKQLEYLAPFLCAKLYRIPMVIAAPSIGPFEPIPTRFIRKWLLQTPKVICVREAISKRYLETLGITDNVHVTMDLALGSNVKVEENQKKLEAETVLNSFLNAHEKVVGITITDFKWHVGLSKIPQLSDRIEEAFQKLIQNLTAKGYGVLLIPQLFGNQNDADYLTRFMISGSTMVVGDEHDAYFQQHLISQLYAVVGMRYHCNIFAAKMGTPFVAISYEEKMDGFLSLSNLSDYAIPVAEIDYEMLEKKFSLLEKNYEVLREQLQENSLRWKENALKTFEHIFII